MDISTLIFVTTVFAVILVFARTIPHPHKKSFNEYPSHVSTAAFRWINMPSVTPSYIGGSFDQIERLRHHSENMRSEARNINDTQLRLCVLAYLDFYDEHWIPKHENELRDQTSLKQLSSYKATQEIERRRVSDLLSGECDSSRRSHD